jgi:hypothetical protein
MCLARTESCRATWCSRPHKQRVACWRGLGPAGSPHHNAPRRLSAVRDAAQAVSTITDSPIMVEATFLRVGPGGRAAGRAASENSLRSCDAAVRTFLAGRAFARGPQDPPRLPGSAAADNYGKSWALLTGRSQPGPPRGTLQQWFPPLPRRFSFGACSKNFGSTPGRSSRLSHGASTMPCFRVGRLGVARACMQARRWRSERGWGVAYCAGKRVGGAYRARYRADSSSREASRASSRRTSMAGDV